jgi:hypothetical protein
MSQSGTVTPNTGSPSNVGTPPGALSVGLFTCTGPLPVIVQGPSSSPLVVQPGQTAVAQVANGVQVTCQASLATPGISTSPPATTSTLTYLIGVLT